MLLATSGVAQVSPGSDELPICASVAFDPDGDGFGWAFNASTNQYSSCAVTAESASAPQIINRQTGASVNLVRAFWDANRDIALMIGLSQAGNKPVILSDCGTLMTTIPFNSAPLTG